MLFYPYYTFSFKLKFLITFWAAPGHAHNRPKGDIGIIDRLLTSFPCQPHVSLQLDKNNASKKVKIDSQYRYPQKEPST